MSNKAQSRRQEKYYLLAKDHGYRSRASFKLVQLNKKYNFLGSAKVCLDLCAAPGGWLQVAQKYMPVSSVLIGVDLVPIKPIAGAITMAEDITSDSCRRKIAKHLHGWKADVVLHDGAPNMGMNWIYDAYIQNDLTLKALRLATDFLREGGTFVTKVFRSRDYNSLLWVFNRFFKNVSATKPSASRMESAEIFVVCEGYIAPDKIDPKMLDAKWIFKEVEEEKKKTLKIFEPTRKGRSGLQTNYDTGSDVLLYVEMTVSDFLESDDPVTLLADHNKVVWDEEAEAVSKHRLTTEEIKEMLQDLKLLGKGEVKKLLKWRLKMRAFLARLEKERAIAAGEVEAAEDEKEEKPLTAEEEEALLDEEIAERLAKQKRDEKRKKKKKRQLAKKRQHLQDMGIGLKKGDEWDMEREDDIFNLEEMEGFTLRTLGDEVASDDSSEERLQRDDFLQQDDGREYTDVVEEYLEDQYEMWKARKQGHLPYSPEERLALVRQQAAQQKQRRKREHGTASWVDAASAPAIGQSSDSQLWFSQSAFGNVDLDLSDDEASGERAEEDSEEELDPRKKKARVQREGQEDEDEDEDSGFEEVPVEDPASDMDEDERADVLAMGKMLVRGEKTMDELVDEAYGRYAGMGGENLKGLPSWFVEDEKRHTGKSIAVHASDVEEIKAKRMTALNVRPIKKIAEAKARKRKRELAKLKKAGPKAVEIASNREMSQQQKVKMIAKLYKGVRAPQREKVYMPTKSFQSRAKKRLAKGKKRGAVKYVDGRMKNDVKAMLRSANGKRHKKRGGKSKKRQRGRH